MRRLSRAEAETRLQNPDVESFDVLARLPEDVDAELAAGAILPLLKERKAVWMFAPQLPTPLSHHDLHPAE